MQHTYQLQITLNDKSDLAPNHEMVVRLLEKAISHYGLSLAESNAFHGIIARVWLDCLEDVTQEGELSIRNPKEWK